MASAFFWFWLGGVVLAWTICPILILAYRDETRRWRACQRVVKQAFRAFHKYMQVLTLVELRVVGHVAPRPVGPMIIVANHPTLVDVTAILSTYDDVCCIVKETLMRNVFVGPLLRTCGHVPGSDRGGIFGANAVDAVQRRLDAGMAVLFFPEGTRSPRGGMRAFRRGAFEMASRARVPVWPLWVTCDPPALSKGLPIWKHPERVARLRIEPLDLAAPPASGRAGCREIESRFRDRLPRAAQLFAPEAVGAGRSAPTAAP